MARPVIAIFDIGKTNKKFFLFDEELNEISEEYIKFPTIEDEDGDECDDLEKIASWAKEKVRLLCDNPDYELKALNFSTYGASFVSIGVDGKPVTPIYNYLKEFPTDLHEAFYNAYPEEEINRVTASPTLGMLNSGLQLYWLKRKRPAVFDRVQYSLHLPQYISYLFTGEAVAEPTSIGCHTKMWDFPKKDYHRWVYDEGISKKLPTIVPTTHYFTKKICGKSVKVGVGIHDSSSALAAYLIKTEEPFALISTGTWSITLNPYPTGDLTFEELQSDCLNFLSIHGTTVKASRFFLGYELDYQVEKLNALFKKPSKYYKDVPCDERMLQDIVFEEIPATFYPETMALTPLVREVFGDNQWNPSEYQTFEQAYHQVMWGLVRMQVASLKLALGSSDIRKVYIDGGFVNNKLFIRMLKELLPFYDLQFSDFPLGSAYGAALMLK
ncbi:Rhamnulokinase RhaK in alpha-proteobacteria [Lunatimonas lonarensis]|uniref:Rhamnulokinase RhaK in alpha-proteobacteria n=1 Tax=Lunatimonas lonarensis TaxID=1232681 RepID=R7ZMF5_9BACT|nr:FGGY family carbohydrate kinase [Lunatimonas lonarensis]EON75280.1 Rhamnulokinase RhaK in alpha-proteobacteria [Lunatimonas lonarensis]